ncbi:MAG TPA: hypothetical protein VED63_01720 [Acidimicrobiales bacterium]|nr:hypothetical protein [Acidimicrobiales bacterium]
MAHITLDSCQSRWVFDTENRRLRRFLKGLGPEERMPTTEWRPYFGLHLDPHSDSFVVMLNDTDPRMLRSWRHRDGVCPQCGARVTAGTEEPSLDDIAHAAAAGKPNSPR